MYLNISVEGAQQTCDLQKTYFPTAKSLICMGIIIILFILKKSWCKDFDFIHNVSISDCELYKNIIIVLWEIRGKFVRTDQLENQQNLIPNDH